MEAEASPGLAPCSFGRGADPTLLIGHRKVHTRAVSSAAQATSEIRLTCEQVAAISRAVADPRRFAMLQQIAQERELACTGLRARDCIRPATISHHLKELQAAGLVSAEREGRGMKLSFERHVWQAYLRQLSSL